MAKFKDWFHVQEGTPAGWQPTARIGHDPLVSALEKVARGSGHMPFAGNFTSPDVFKTKFGMDDNELGALNKVRLIRKNPTTGGFNIDQNSFNSIFQQVRGMKPTMGQPGPAAATSQGSALPPPPPPPGRPMAGNIPPRV